MQILPVGPRDEIPVRDGRPVFLTDHPGEPVSVAPGYFAVRVSSGEVRDLGRPVAPRDLNDRLVDASVSLLRNRERVRFDPSDGSELRYGDGGVAYGASGRPLYPRLDPAVIGLVELAGADRLLLGMNAQRRKYFSLVAGYVSHGESLEEAFAREVWEETGRRVGGITYVGSQPWPVSGSLMVGMRGSTADEHPQADTDGELIEVIWVSARDIRDRRVPIAPPGSIAHDMILAWAAGKNQ